MFARFLAMAAVRLGVPSVLGELLAGLLLGPTLLGLVEPGEVVRVLAEIGITLLLFEVGLETDMAFEGVPIDNVSSLLAKLDDRRVGDLNERARLAKCSLNCNRVLKDRRP